MVFMNGLCAWSLPFANFTGETENGIQAVLSHIKARLCRRSQSVLIRRAFEFHSCCGKCDAWIISPLHPPWPRDSERVEANLFSKYRFCPHMFSNCCSLVFFYFCSFHSRLKPPFPPPISNKHSRNLEYCLCFFFFSINPSPIAAGVFVVSFRSSAFYM